MIVIPNYYISVAGDSLIVHDLIYLTESVLESLREMRVFRKKLESG